MFFAPALIVAAASAVSAAPLAMPAQQAVQQNLGLDLEDKDAFFLFDMIKKVFGKRDLESMDHHEIARALADLDEEKQAAFKDIFMKWGVPVIGGLISGLPDLIHGKKENKRDLELEDKDAFFLFDMIKKVFGKRDLEELEDKDAFFLFDMIKKVFGKRGLEGEVDIDNMSDDEKKAFWGAVAKWGVPVLGGLISGLPDLIHGKKNKRDLELEDKDAFFLFDMIKKVFGKRGLEGEDEDKDAFFLFDIIKKVFGKRGLEGEVDLENMNDDEKKAFWGAVAKWGVPIISGLFSGMGSGSKDKRELDHEVFARAIQELDLEDKDAFFLFDMIKKVFGKRDLEGEDEDKDAFFLFDIIKKVFGKRDLEELEDKDAFFLFDIIKKVFGKRDLEGEDEDKDAFFLFDIIKKVFGKRDLEELEDKDAFFLFDMIKKVFGKRDLEDLEDKDAFFLFDMIKKVFGKRDLEDLEDKDAFFLFDMIKKVFGKRDLETLEDKDAFFLFDMIKKVFGKRDLETLEDKDAFFLFDMIKKVFGKRGLEGEVDVDNMSDDEKKAFWGAVAKWGVPIISGLFSGLGSKDKRDLYDLPTVPSAARRSLESSFARRAVQDQGLLDALNDF